jgi:hypothetical protein
MTPKKEVIFMSGNSKKEYWEKIRWRYRRSGRLGKGRILDEFCQVCGYERKYAIKLLNRRKARPLRRPGPKPHYGKTEVAVLRQIWLAADQMCSKRLKAALPLWLPYYEGHHGELELEIRTKILKLSASTMDRLLAPIRVKYRGKGMGGTKPGSLLKTQIPIRTDNWDIQVPGFMEADTVAHCGISLSGDFIWSLVFTDIATGWTQQRAVWNKGSQGVIAQVRDIESKLPFELLGFDCDNGSEFLNHHLWSYFVNRKKPVQFTRSRPYKKNDNAHVEQKNWTHVRQLLGYDRFEKPSVVDLLNELYANEWQAYQNFFCPSVKLLEKKRVGSKYKRRYDQPQTPYQRLLAFKAIDEPQRQALRQAFAALNPFKLKIAIERKLKAIFDANKVQSI